MSDFNEIIEKTIGMIYDSPEHQRFLRWENMKVKIIRMAASRGQILNKKSIKSMAQYYLRKELKG